MSLFATKPLESILAEAEGGTLKRSLGPGPLVGLGIGAIIGAGLFSLTGIAAAQNAGPAVVLSFVLAAIGCAFAGICYSEFSTMIPIAGSAYTYAYATMGEFIAWIIGWDLVFEYAIGASTVSVSWSAYVVSFLKDFGISFPAQFAASPFEPVKLPGTDTVIHGVINLPALFIVIIVSGILIIGIQESARVNALIVCLKVAGAVLFILLGWGYINGTNYEPFVPPNTGQFGAFGWSGVVRAAGVVFFAFIGFDAAFAPISALGEMTSIGTLFAFVLVCAGIIIMRRTHPDQPRPFKTPLVPLIPILGIIFNFLLMYGLGWTNWLRLVVWMAIGMVIYFTYSRKRSITHG